MLHCSTSKSPIPLQKSYQDVMIMMMTFYKLYIDILQALFQNYYFELPVLQFVFTEGHSLTDFNLYTLKE